MIADYFFIRNKTLNVKEMYEVNGEYSYKNGFNKFAIIALLLGILPNIPGFLTTIHAVKQDMVWDWLSGLYHYAWFVGFFVSGISYMIMMRNYKTQTIR